MNKLSLFGACFIILLIITGAGAITIENLRKLDIPETTLWDPVLSPDGTRIAFVAYDSDRNQQIFVINLDGSGKKKLTDDIYKKWGIAWGIDKIAYVSFGKDGLEKISVMNPDGTDNIRLISDNTRQGNPPEREYPPWAAPSWSPDGKTLLYTSLDEMANSKMYVVNADGTGKRQVFTNDTFKQWSPSWSPDGKNIVYVSYNNLFREELFIIDAAGTAKRQLTSDELKKNNPVWGPEGTITYISYENKTSHSEKIFAINKDGTNRRLFVDSDYSQRSPIFSHDGKKFAYAAIDKSGVLKIAVGDTVGISVSPTPTPSVTPTVTGQPEPSKTTAAETPAVEEPPAGLKDVVMTMLLVLAIIVVVMFVILVISNILSKKK